MLGDYPDHRIEIADVGSDERIPTIANLLNFPQIFSIPGISQLIDVNDPAPKIGSLEEKMTDEIAPDETASPRNEKVFERPRHHFHSIP
jgi:hypothetical protein